MKFFHLQPEAGAQILAGLQKEQGKILLVKEPEELLNAVRNGQPYIQVQSHFDLRSSKMKPSSGGTWLDLAGGGSGHDGQIIMVRLLFPKRRTIRSVSRFFKNSSRTCSGLASCHSMFAAHSYSVFTGITVKRSIANRESNNCKLSCFMDSCAAMTTWF